MANTFVNLTASGIVIPGEGVLESMYVNNTSAGTMILYSSPSTTENLGTVIGTTDITPAAGFHYLGNIHSTPGIYCAIGGTLDVTFHIKESN